MRNNLINGALAGGILSILYVILYIFKPEVVFNSGFTYGTLTIIPLIFMLRACKQEREINNGVLSFGDAFLKSMAVFIIAILIYMFAGQIMLMIFPEQYAIAGEIQLEQAESMYRSMGMPEEAIQEALDKMSEMFDENGPSLSMYLLGILSMLFVPGLPIGILSAVITKRNPHNA